MRARHLVGPVAALALAGCSSDPAARDRACAHGGDGVCDEPVNCALGTDEADCAAACAGPGPTYLFAAACAHRQPPEEPDYADPAPSGGTLHLTGTRDGVLAVPSGVEGGGLVEREYRLYVPSSYDPARAHPLVINMAGHRVGHQEHANFTQLLRSAELNRFLVVFAGQEFRQGRWAWWTDWDWQERKAENPDLAFLRGIVETVAAGYEVDLGRVYLSGHSRGAAMALIGALELPDLIAGAAVESGFTEFGYLDTLAPAHARKVPLWFFHGTKDPDVCIDCRPGGRCGVTLRGCGEGMHATDAIVERLRELGWTDGELVYERLPGVTHRWQEQLNQQWWDFLSARPRSR